jgi:hypothetical protein
VIVHQGDHVREDSLGHGVLSLSQKYVAKTRPRAAPSTIAKPASFQ